MWLHCDFVYTGMFGDDLSEQSLFNDIYVLLCNTIIDIVDPLMKCLTEENHFTTEEQKQIADITSASDTIRTLLLNISNSLNANNTKAFYIMLKIMKEHGGETTLNLADHIMNRLKVSPNTMSYVSNDIKVQNDKPKS